MENNDNPPGVTVNHDLLTGYIRKDLFGRLFIDKCASDEEHLTSAKTPPGEERSGCRKYLDELVVPKEVLGKKVRVYFEFRITDCRENT